MSTGLKEQLTALIADALMDCWYPQDNDEADMLQPSANQEGMFIAQRLASAFQQVGWVVDDAERSFWWVRDNEGRDSLLAQNYEPEPVYRFARPESVELKESNE